MNPNEIYQKLHTAGQEMVEANAVADQLEAALKSQIALLTTQIQDLESCSHATAKDMALSTSSYGDSVQAAIEARRLAHSKRITYDSIKVWVDCTRTQAANERFAAGVAT